jgi:hypothetical protein
MDSEIVETRVVTLQVKDNIFIVRYKDNVVADLDDVKEVYEIHNKLAEGKVLRVMLNFGKYTSLTKEAREYAQNVKIPAVAEAMVVSNLAQRLIMNFYTMYRKIKTPLKVFKAEEDAFKFLAKHPMLVEEDPT